MIKIIIIIVLMWSFSVDAATYYIDFNAGSDTNSGTSSSSPWRHIPGTLKTTPASEGDYISTCYGSGCPGTPTFSPSVKVPADTVFKLKSGTTHNAANGGQIMLGMKGDFYLSTYTLANGVTFQRDPTWGTGAVTFDGTGITLLGGNADGGFGLIHMGYTNSTNPTGGFTFDGVTTDGFVVQNSPQAGISHFSRPTRPAGFNVYYAKFYNNCTASTDDTDGASTGNIKIENVQGGTIRYVNIDGNNNWCNGIIIGDNPGGGSCVAGSGGCSGFDITISDVVITRHSGDNDCGMGIKSLAGTITVTNAELSYGWKGADNGNKNPDYASSAKYVNCNIHNNLESGINFNGGTAVGISSQMTGYVINSIVRDNGSFGTNSYGSIKTLYIVHSLFDNNGSGAWESWNIADTNDEWGEYPDSGAVRLYLYNNIFYKPNATQNFFNKYWNQTIDPYSNINIYSDYNSWVQRSTEYMSVIGAYSPSLGGCNIAYGANGPGHTSGTWYASYGCTTSPPSNGSLGHYHQDSHSKGTGATDTTLPPFTDVANHNYVLTTTYSGVNLTAQPWYISEMGLDRNGATRKATPDIGPYEYGAATTAIGSGVTITGGNAQ